MKPILFNTEMVRAILEGRKTVTRRVIKPQPTYSPRDGFSYKGRAYGTDLPPTVKGAGYNLRCAAPYKVGDVLYVRETWTDWNCTECDGDCISDNGITCTAPKYLYKADGAEISKGWKPSIHMPKEAARLFLRVTGVKLERLQDICNRGTPKDHIKRITSEGLEFQPVMENYQKLIDDFKKLWNSTVKKNQIDTYGWNANPYVWVIEFERIDKLKVAT